jgi:hypothetical protein
MKRLRDEIIGRLGTSNHPTSDDLKEMKYLRAVINETLRSGDISAGLISSTDYS